MSEKIDPLGDPSAQSLLDWLGVNLDVANGGADGESLNLLLNCSVLGNLSLKAIQRWVILAAILGLLALSSQELLQHHPQRVNTWSYPDSRCLMTHSQVYALRSCSCHKRTIAHRRASTQTWSRHGKIRTACTRWHTELEAEQSEVPSGFH